MIINCPLCGPRPTSEFTYRGDASKKRPEIGSDADEQAHFDYVYLRENIRGRTQEHWLHSGGCRSWLVVDRDTMSHEIFSVTEARKVKPGRAK